MSRPPRFDAGELIKGEHTEPRVVSETPSILETAERQKLENLVHGLLEEYTDKAVQSNRPVLEGTFINPWELTKDLVQEKHTAPENTYTLDPRMQGVELSVDKLKSLQWQDAPGQDNSTFIHDYVFWVRRGPDRLPGLETMRFMLDHLSELPHEFMDGNRLYFFGSLISRANGAWCVPYLEYSNNRLAYGLDTMGGKWSIVDRVVVLKDG